MKSEGNLHFSYNPEKFFENDEHYRKFLEACKEEGIDYEELQGNWFITESQAEKLNKVYEKIGITFSKGNEITPIYHKDENTVYKCRCGMFYTESDMVASEAVRKHQVCSFCLGPLERSTSRSRPAYIIDGDSEIPYSMTQPESREGRSIFGSTKYYTHKIHGYWRCSCGYTYVESLDEFMEFDAMDTGVCSLCKTKLRIHSDTRGIGRKKVKTKEEIEELLELPFVATGEENEELRRKNGKI